MSLDAKTRRLVAHLLVVIAGGLVVLVVILIILHRVRVFGVHLIPVDVLSTRATAALDDVFLGDGLEVAVVFVILLVWSGAEISMNQLELSIVDKARGKCMVWTRATVTVAAANKIAGGGAYHCPSSNAPGQ